MRQMTEKVNLSQVEVRIEGKTHRLPAARVLDRTVIVTGKVLRQASVMDEKVALGKVVRDPVEFVCALGKSGLRADYLTFSQKVSDPTPKFPYRFEWDNWAVADVSSFKKWWDNLPQISRKNVRRSVKRGVVTKVAEFNDEFICQIKTIYDETPLRQGRGFYHYGKDVETVKRENSTYLERSDFLGAYLGEELIGFIKLIYADETAHIIQILAKNAHQDKRVMNALMAKAAEVCASRGVSHLVYGKYAYYRNQKSTLAEFKKRNGFEEVRVPRYLVPLSRKGSICLTLGLHKPLKEMIPSPILNALVSLRSAYYRRKQSAQNDSSEVDDAVRPGKMIEQA
jgi:hypothetical protein